MHLAAEGDVLADKDCDGRTGLSDTLVLLLVARLPFSKLSY